MTGPCRGIVLEVNATRRNGSEAYTKVQGRCSGETKLFWLESTASESLMILDVAQAVGCIIRLAAPK
jgi:hypothetical protein